MAKPGEVERKWYVVDATDVLLDALLLLWGASVLRGKQTNPHHTLTYR